MWAIRKTRERKPSFVDTISRAARMASTLLKYLIYAVASAYIAWYLWYFFKGLLHTHTYKDNRHNIARTDIRCPLIQILLSSI